MVFDEMMRVQMKMEFQNVQCSIWWAVGVMMIIKTFPCN